MNKKILSGLCVCALIFAIIAVPSEAATGKQGYAVYRDGVLGPVNWHAGIMDKASKDDIYPVIHSAGSGHNVAYGSWDEFMNVSENCSFVGYYRPVSQNPTSTQRDAVNAVARQLAADFIGYTIGAQIAYDEDSSTTKAVVQPSDIESMRCDGVVEYCYEYNNIRIYGDDGNWNISKWGGEYKSKHEGFGITPRKQAQDYMYLVSY